MEEHTCFEALSAEPAFRIVPATTKRGKVDAFVDIEIISTDNEKFVVSFHGYDAEKLAQKILYLIRQELIQARLLGRSS